MSQVKYIYLLFLFVFAFTVNWLSGNTGVMPIDTFSFFDTGYSILKDNLPVIPIYYDQAICFLKNDVKNLKLSPINTIDFKYVDKK